MPSNHFAVNTKHRESGPGTGERHEEQEHHPTSLPKDEADARGTAVGHVTEHLQMFRRMVEIRCNGRVRFRDFGEGERLAAMAAKRDVLGDVDVIERDLAPAIRAVAFHGGKFTIFSDNGERCGGETPICPRLRYRSARWGVVNAELRFYQCSVHAPPERNHMIRTDTKWRNVSRAADAAGRASGPSRAAGFGGDSTARLGRDASPYPH